MPLSPYPRRSHEYQPRHTHTAQMVSGQQCHLREVSPEIERQGHCVGRQEGTQGRSNDGEGGENKEDDVSFP